jgi:hypothetical protein
MTVHNSRPWDEDCKLARRVLQEKQLGEVYRIGSCYSDCSTNWGSRGAQAEAARQSQDRGGVVDVG